MKKILSLVLLLTTLRAGAQVLRKPATLPMSGRFEITFEAEESVTTEQNIDT